MCQGGLIDQGRPNKTCSLEVICIQSSVLIRPKLFIFNEWSLRWWHTPYSPFLTSLSAVGCFHSPFLTTSVPGIRDRDNKRTDHVAILFSSSNLGHLEGKESKIFWRQSLYHCRMQISSTKQDTVLLWVSILPEDQGLSNNLTLVNWTEVDIPKICSLFLLGLFSSISWFFCLLMF